MRERQRERKKQREIERDTERDTECVYVREREIESGKEGGM